MFSYNFFLILLLILACPFIFVKLIIARRFRYKFIYRLFPKPINSDSYVLVHIASLGEAKAFLNIKDTIEELFQKKIVFTVTSDIGYNYLKSLSYNVYLAPVDFYPLYNRLFSYSMPLVAFFFETEIWPSYICFLKKYNIKLFLINARISKKSYKFYRKFKVFSKAISYFDAIIAKSKEDKARYVDFSKEVYLCDNVKFALKKNDFGDQFDYLKLDNKKIFVFASVHKEELQFLKSALLEVMSLGYRIIIAPRYLDQLGFFEDLLKSLNLEYVLYSKFAYSKLKNCILVDSFGILEAIYSVSNVVFVCGSLASSLKGHNPIEPAIYGNFVLCGEFMDSFKEETKFLKDIKVLKQIYTIAELKNVLSQVTNPASCNFSQKRQDIIACYRYVLSQFTQA